jgi:hypothetical protein
VSAPISNVRDNPTLPSAKPAKASLLILFSLSALMGVAGIGLGSSAIGLYMARAESRVAKDEELTAIEQRAEIQQRDAQLQRNYEAPLWDATQVYDPAKTYSVDGVRRLTVPVLIGPELDTAICIGSIGPDGFVQNIDDPICLGY